MMQANTRAAGQQLVGLGSLIAYGQVCTIHSSTGVHICHAQTCCKDVPSIVCSTQGCKPCKQQQMLYLDQQLAAIAAAFPRQQQLRRQLPAGILNCEEMSFHTCRSVSIMTQASGNAWLLSHCLLVCEEQGQQAHLDTKCSCLCRVSDVTGCDDVYTSSKASP